MDYLKQLKSRRRSFIQTVLKWGLFPHSGKMPTGEKGNFAWIRTAQLAANMPVRVFCTNAPIALNSVTQKRMPTSPAQTWIGREVWEFRALPVGGSGRGEGEKKGKRKRSMCSGNKLNPAVKDHTVSSRLLVKPAAMVSTGTRLPASTADCRAAAWIYSSLAELAAELKLSATIFKLIKPGHCNPTHVIEIATFRH